MIVSLDHVIEWGKKLKPPSGASSGKEITAWRWMVALTLGVTSLGLAAHIAIACGYLSFFHPGFARADEISKVDAKVQAVSDDIKAARIAQLKVGILDAKQKQCSAAPGVRALYTDSLQNMIIEYEQLAQRRYPLPDCASF